ncbi:CLUMA_CG015910, isoform A [Clunio marinus]|uniref:CLUMA_CG015910, isoform A n=1 Tax=Clunio marinus TaxID=568069 RepID=A0A1J1IU60_9DIPT|nr:CLUMA_CG015910, isoform A [Clunio marinus]
MSAAFIVLLAVLSVAALAFYFTTLVFDCIFRIAKGDVFSSGLKYNHTSIYKQKTAFYTKFIETSLEHGNFNVAKTEINGFGAGPDVQLSFRIYLDMRKIQMTITNVEEHIKNAFISETAHRDSIFRNLRIDDGSIEIKRQLDPEILRQAALFREQVITIEILISAV